MVSVLFATSMHPAAPTSTMILLKVQVLPADVTHKTVRIDYAINARDITFEDTPEQTKHVMLDLMAVAWDKNGKDCGEASDRRDVKVPLSTYRDVMRSYIPAHQELQARTGTYTLRLGVIDRFSRKIGSVDIPLTVPEPAGLSKVARPARGRGLFG